MQLKPESGLFETAEQTVDDLDKRIVEAMEPPIWVQGARESENPDVRAQIQEWWNQQWQATEPLRRTRNQIIIQAARLRELESPMRVIKDDIIT